MAVMKRLDHPNVVKLHEVVFDAADPRLLIMIMEFLPGGALLALAGTGAGADGAAGDAARGSGGGMMTEPLSEALARSYFRDVVQGLDYLNSNGVVHGDLKPDNLLIGADGHVKLSDFGSSCVLPDGLAAAFTTSFQGTPAFAAPECCVLRGGAAWRPVPAECWALGVTLYMFVFGCTPFKGDSVLRLYEQIREAPVPFPASPYVSPPLRALLEGLLDKDPEKRLGLAQVASHGWVTQGGRLPPVRLWGDAGGGGLAGLSSAEQSSALTAWVHQVKQAVPSIEEKVFKRGQELIREGCIPLGLFLITKGTCEIVRGGCLSGGGATASAAGGGPSRPGTPSAAQQQAPRADAAASAAGHDFADRLSDSEECSSDEADYEEDSGSCSGSFCPMPALLGSGTGASSLTAAELAGSGSWSLGASGSSPGADAAGMDLDESGPEPVARGGYSEGAGRQKVTFGLFGGGSRGAINTGNSPRRLSVARISTLISRIAAAAAPSPPAPRPPAALVGGGGVLGIGQPSAAEGGSGAGGPSSVFSPGRRRRAVTIDMDILPRTASEASCGSARGRSPSHAPSRTLSALDYATLAHAGSPDAARGAVAPSGRSFFSPGRYGGAGGRAGPAPASLAQQQHLQVQQSAGSAASLGPHGGARAAARAVRRSPSMHARMVSLVQSAKERARAPVGSQDLITLRGAGQVVGDLCLNGKPAPASATVRAKTRVRALLVRRQDADILRSQPVVKAALARTQTESSILEVLERFASFDSEVTAVEELRRLTMSAGAGGSFTSAGAGGAGGGDLTGLPAHAPASPLGLAAAGASGSPTPSQRLPTPRWRDGG